MNIYIILFLIFIVLGNYTIKRYKQLKNLNSLPDTKISFPEETINEYGKRNEIKIYSYEEIQEICNRNLKRLNGIKWN